MASLTEIRNALAKQIREYVDAPINVYGLVEDSGRLPAVMIEPVEIDYLETMNNSFDSWEFNIFVLVGRGASTAGAQGLLDQLIASQGPNSVVAAIYSDRTLGLDDSTEAIVHHLKGYGGRFDWQQNQHVGAVLKMTVNTDGRVTSTTP